MPKNEANRLAKEYIVSALITLMKERPYDEITITDITRKAGVSRMAYYRNYTSKEDILNKYMEDVGRAIHEKIRASRQSERLYDYYYALFEQLGAYSDVGIAAYQAHLGELILANVNKQMLITFPPEEKGETVHYRSLFPAGAFYNIFIEWLKSGRRESCAQMAQLCCEMTQHGCGGAVQ